MRSWPVKLHDAKGGRRGPKEAKSFKVGTAASSIAPTVPPPPARATGIASYWAKLMPDDICVPKSAATADALVSLCVHRGQEELVRRVSLVHHMQIHTHIKLFFCACTCSGSLFPVSQYPSYLRTYYLARKDLAATLLHTTPEERCLATLYV